MTEEEKKAIYDVVINSIIDLTAKTKAASFTGEQIWENTKHALVTLFPGLPEGVAAFLIREAWEKAAES